MASEMGGSKNKPSDIQRKKMLERKTNPKASYVKKKRIEIDYDISEYQMKAMDVKYDLISIIARINQAHAYGSKSASWLIAELQKRRTMLPPKAVNILFLAGLSVEARLRLLNLKNCVRWNDRRCRQT